MVTAKKSSAAKTGTVTTAVSPKPKTAAKKALTMPAAETSAVPKAAVKKAPAKTSATTAATRPAVSAEQRHHYIEVAAFYVAQRRGFSPGNPADDWAMAEREVDRLIASGHFSK